MTEPLLSMQNVAFGYGSRQILTNINCDMRQGRLTAICGPNGSGKSTLFGLASGQFQASSGQVRMGPHDIAKLPPKQRARHMAMLPQSPEAPMELLVRDLVGLGRYAHRKPLSGLGPEDRKAVDAGMQATAMSEFADRTLASLSGGQRQRAWIAMILAQEAPLLMLDEPTNHLDIGHAAETLDLLKRLVTEQGKSAIVILHDINLMASHADDVILLKDGQILSQGTFEEAVSEEVLTDLFDRKCRFGSVQGRDRPFIVVH